MYFDCAIRLINTPKSKSPNLVAISLLVNQFSIASTPSVNDFKVLYAFFPLNVVQDDLELICWDIVSTPSTPNAWILNSKSEISNFTESKHR